MDRVPLGSVWTHEEQADLICRIVSRGRILKQDNGRYFQVEAGCSFADPYTTMLFLVKHPDLPEGEVYAIFTSRMSLSGGVWRCKPEEAQRVINASGAWNYV